MYIVSEEIKAGDKIFIHHSEDKVVVARWPLNETLYAGVAMCDMQIGYQVSVGDVDWVVDIFN